MKQDEKELILDGNVPTISLGMIKEEFILYNLDKTSAKEVLNQFTEITGQGLNLESSISQLSHGQKLILTAIIALYSNAKKITFLNFFNSISNKNREKIYKIIEDKKCCKKITIIENGINNNSDIKSI